MSRRRKSGQRSSSSASATASISTSESEDVAFYESECSIVREEHSVHTHEISKKEAQSSKAGVVTCTVEVEEEDEPAIHDYTPSVGEAKLSKYDSDTTAVEEEQLEAARSDILRIIDEGMPIVNYPAVTSKPKSKSKSKSKSKLQPTIAFGALHAAPFVFPLPRNKVADLINAGRDARNARLALDMRPSGVEPPADGPPVTKSAPVKKLASTFLPDSFKGLDIDMAIIIAYLEANDMLHLLHKDGERILREGMQMKGPLRPFLQTRFLCAQFELAKRRQRNKEYGDLAYEEWKLLKWAEGRYAKLAGECGIEVVKDARYYQEVSKFALDPKKADRKSFYAVRGCEYVVRG